MVWRAHPSLHHLLPPLLPTLAWIRAAASSNTVHFVVITDQGIYLRADPALSAVAAATAFRLRFIRQTRQDRKKQGGSFAAAVKALRASSYEVAR
jgi:hypothetical protein